MWTDAVDSPLHCRRFDGSAFFAEQPQPLLAFLGAHVKERPQSAPAGFVGRLRSSVAAA
jgi:hypothetical protein